MIASQPCASSQIASSTVVADDRITAPVARTRASSAGAGNPKWKLTTSGLLSSTRPHQVSSNGARVGAAITALGSTPSSA